jgi:hypothetical protein
MTMPTYAIMSNGIVQNKVLADSAEDLLEFPEVQWIADDAIVDIGWGFSDGVFTAPPPVPVDPATAALDARKRRNEILVNTVDPYVMNSLRWADLSAEQQGEIAAYRRALLDITDQAGFPLEVTWPTLPAFM